MEYILFDLDNTLYSAEQDLCDQVSARIKRYMIEVAGIPLDQVDDLRHSYWKRYGLTMQGLMRHHGVNPEEYLSYVHDVDIASIIRPDPELCRALRSLPLRRAIFTNSTTDHSERVLNALGLDGVFEEIFDIRVADYRPKPYPEPYHAVLDRLGIAASGCIMVEDSPDNLKTAKQLGMGTILVGQQTSFAWVDAAVQEAVQVPQVLGSWIQG